MDFSEKSTAFLTALTTTRLHGIGTVLKTQKRKKASALRGWRSFFY